MHADTGDTPIWFAVLGGVADAGVPAMKDSIRCFLVCSVVLLEDSRTLYDDTRMRLFRGACQRLQTASLIMNACPCEDKRTRK